MNEEEKDICRLCLKCEGDTFSLLDESSKEKLKVIVPELNLDAATGLVICSACRESSEESHKLKKMCSETDQFVRAQLKTKNITDKVNLNRIMNIYNEAHGTNTEVLVVENICGICLKTRKNCMSINMAKREGLFTSALETCLSEFDAELTADPVICEVCHDMLRYMYSFKTRCLSVEEKLKRYKETTSENEVNLTKVLTFLKTEAEKSLDEDDFLSEFEVKDEAEMDIFAAFPSFSAQSSTTENSVPQMVSNDKTKAEVEDYKSYYEEEAYKSHNDRKRKDSNFSENKGKKKMEKLRCFSCRKYGHVQSECLQTFKTLSGPNGEIQPWTPSIPTFTHKRGSRPPPRGTCAHCGKPGHANKHCSTLKKTVGMFPTPKPRYYNAGAQEQDIERNYTPEMVQERIQQNNRLLGCLKCFHYGHNKQQCKKVRRRKQREPCRVDHRNKDCSCWTRRN